jgi:hypothetical protein
MLDLMKPLVTSLLLLIPLTSIHADPGWQKKTIGNVRIEVPSDSNTEGQNMPGSGGAVQKMTKYSFRTRVLDLELVFLAFPPGTAVDLNGAAANMSEQIKANPAKKPVRDGNPQLYPEDERDTSRQDQTARMKQGK